MRILHVLDISVPMLAGYTSRTRYLVNAQRALGLDPVILTSVRQDNPKGAAMEEIDGIRHHRTPPPLSRLFPDRVGQAPVAKESLEINHLRGRIIEIARRERPDLIHAHSSILCGIPAYLASRQLGLPCVYEVRAFWEDAAVDAGTNREGSLKYAAIRQAETRLARRADALVGICEGIKQELIARRVEEQDVFVVPNGVDTERFGPIEPDESVRARYGLGGKRVVAYIGTFAAFEGVRYLIQALARLIRSGRDDVRGLIVGEGPTYEACRQLSRDLGVSEMILHPGRVPHGEVKGLYSIADVLAYPRDSQRITELVTPLKPLEAMAMEKAVIGSDVGGLRELIQDGVTGLLHRHEDPDHLAETISRLVDDEALRVRLGKQARAYVIEHRQWRKIVERHFALYERARENWSRNQYLWKGLARMASQLGLGMEG